MVRGKSGHCYGEGRAEGLARSPHLMTGRGRTVRTVRRVVNGTTGLALEGYDRYAAQRQPAVPPSKPTETVYVGDGSSIEAWHGMVRFPFARRYTETLESAGLRFRPRLFSEEVEKDRLRQWPVITADSLRHYVEGQWDLPERPVFVGHSAGGFTVMTLAMLAKGNAQTRTAIREGLGLQDLSLEQIEAFSERVRERAPLFIAIAAPLNGIVPTRLGKVTDRQVLRRLDPDVFTALTYDYVQGFYRRVGMQPQEVIDGIIVSDGAPWPIDRHPASWATNTIVQGGMRAWSVMVDTNARYDQHTVDPGEGFDGIVPLRSAWLEGPMVRWLHDNHLALVETEESAWALASMIHDLRGPQDYSLSPLQAGGDRLFH